MSCFTFVHRKILSKMNVPFYLWGLKSYKYMSWNYCQAYILLKLWIFCPYTHPLVPCPPPCPIFKTLYWNCLSDVLLWKWDDICKILLFSYILYSFWCLCIIYFNHLLMFSFNDTYVTSLKQFQSHLLFICFMHQTMSSREHNQ